MSLWLCQAIRLITSVEHGNHQVCVGGFREHDPWQWTWIRTEGCEVLVAARRKDHHVRRTANRTTSLEHIAYSYTTRWRLDIGISRFQ